MLQLKILRDTILKQQILQSTQLPNAQKQDVKAGTVFNLAAHVPASDHIKVTLANQALQGKNTWYAYQRHVAILEDGKISFPQAVRLSIPYYDQLDNSENPFGTCNVTSIAMCLAYMGIGRRRPELRFPDELYLYCEKNGLDRHEPADLKKLVEAYGCKDAFSTTASFERVKEWLVLGNPAVMHGYFTSYGHIVVAIGYNAKGFIVNDPYGELMYTAPGNSYYDTYASGAGLTYSYNLIYNTCCTDKQFWVHFISRN
ncbi:C39 family peptidase [Pantanalinema sp. GBBB05]|uniref:C39 family peptidase n=1 Tax=Pantanalinema sp. GBBB05 TaxID=2604139 RepID=UPI001D6EB2AC|nr:C39 family peptidase [Pantanalinema sp. GBBB05]